MPFGGKVPRFSNPSKDSCTNVGCSGVLGRRGVTRGGGGVGGVAPTLRGADSRFHGVNIGFLLELADVLLIADALVPEPV